MKLNKLFLLLSTISLLISCNKNGYYLLTEKTFFLVMTNIQYYPEQYVNKTIEYDCFTYQINDINSDTYICGVRKCSSGLGCTCGNDTIIGFLLNSEVELPEPKNQSEDTNDKTWVHLKGYIPSVNKKTITIYSYNSDGTINTSQTEELQLLSYVVETCELINDSSNLHYYVTK